MSQDEQWLDMWWKYMDFMRKNKRRPSKYKPEERFLVNWAKHNRKLINKGQFQPSRMKKFMELKHEAEKYQRVNQYMYVNGGIVEE